jgi:tetratricopeptide (TPR) repeat protein
MSRSSLQVRACVAICAGLLSLCVDAQQWGIQVRNAQNSAGAEVVAVTPGTPAEVAEIRPGDVIVQVQGRPIANALQFTQATQGVGIGATLAVTVSRQGWERELRLSAPPTLASFGLTVRDGGAGGAVEIASVVANGPAAVAGLQPGDVITAAEGGKVASAASVSGLLQEAAAQAKALTFTVMRENWAKEVTIMPRPLGVASTASPNPPSSGATSTASASPSSTPRADTGGSGASIILTNRDDVIADLGNGNRAYDAQNWPDAEIYFKRVILAFPEEPRAWARLCHAQVMQARFAEALDTCQHAGKIAPRDASVLQNIGYSLFRLGKHSDSIVWYQRAIEVKPDWAQPYAGIGAAQFALGNWAKAEESYKLVVAREPGNQSAWQSLGDVTGEQGKTTDAIGNYRKALSLGPANVELYRGLGWQLSKEGKLAEAETALLDATRLNPRDVSALVSLGLVEDKLGKPSQARDAWQRAADLDPGGKLGSIARENLASLAARSPQAVAAPAVPPTAQTAPMRVELAPQPRVPDPLKDQPLPIDDPDVDAGK